MKYEHRILTAREPVLPSCWIAYLRLIIHPVFVGQTMTPMEMGHLGMKRQRVIILKAKGWQLYPVGAGIMTI